MQIQKLAKSLVVSGLIITAVSTSYANGDIGGSDVGGGGTIDLPLATHDQIKDGIKKSKRVLSQWLMGQETRVLMRQVESHWAYSKIFALTTIPQGEDTIFKRLLDLEIEYRTDRACFDKNGFEHDASIYTTLNNKNAICISGYRLVTKLRQDDYDYKIAALILHEVSHLLGTDEPEAQFLQRESLRALRTANFDATIDNVTHVFRAGSLLESGTNRLIKMVEDKMDIHNLDINTDVRELESRFTGTLEFYNFHEKQDALFSPLRALNIDRAQTAYARLDNLDAATCIQPNWRVENCHLIYEKIFNGARFLYASAFFRMAERAGVSGQIAWPTSPIVYDGPVSRVRTAKQLVEALKEIREDARVFQKEASSDLFRVPFKVTET